MGVDVIEEFTHRGHGDGEDDECILRGCALEGGDEISGDIKALVNGGSGAGAGAIITENRVADGMEVTQQGSSDEAEAKDTDRAGDVFGSHLTSVAHYHYG
ncbi:hypothetical protein GCM10027580_11310 [Corynebacterium faecale]